MINIINLQQAMIILRNEVGRNIKDREQQIDNYHELCEIAGRLKVLIRKVSKDGGSKKLI